MMTDQSGLVIGDRKWWGASSSFLWNVGKHPNTYRMPQTTDHFL